MCKTWPGLRCTDHPHQRIIKYNQQTVELETALSKTYDKMNAIVTEYDDENAAKESPEYQALLARTESLKEKIVDLETRQREAMNDYAMSAGGREELEKIINDETLSKNVRTAAAAEYLAAINRIEDQRDIARVLKSDVLTEDEKQHYLELQQRSFQQSIDELKEDQTKVAELIHTTKKLVKDAKERKDKEAYTELTRKQQYYGVLSAMYAAEIEQREGLVREIQNHRQKKATKKGAILTELTGEALYKMADIAEWSITGDTRPVRNIVTGRSTRNQNLHRGWAAELDKRLDSRSKKKMEAANEKIVQHADEAHIKAETKNPRTASLDGENLPTQTIYEEHQETEEYTPPSDTTRTNLGSLLGMEPEPETVETEKGQ